MIQVKTNTHTQYIAKNSILEKKKINKFATNDTRIKITLMPELQSSTYMDTGDTVL